MTVWEVVMVMLVVISYFDLGCGIGSVLLMVSWRLCNVWVFGIEVFVLSVKLVEKNVWLNVFEFCVLI